MSMPRPVQPSPALVVACCALLVALGGTAYAVAALPAHSVGPAQLKKNAVTSKVVKNGSLRAADFKRHALPGELTLRYSGDDATDVAAVIGAGPDTVVNSVLLSKGRYDVRAMGIGINTHVALQGELRCYLRTDGNILAAGMPGMYLPLEPKAGTNNNRGVFSMEFAVRISTPAAVRVECDKGAAAQTMIATASISALRVGAIAPGK